MSHPMVSAINEAFAEKRMFTLLHYYTDGDLVYWTAINWGAR